MWGGKGAWASEAPFSLHCVMCSRPPAPSPSSCPQGACPLPRSPGVGITSLSSISRMPRRSPPSPLCAPSLYPRPPPWQLNPGPAVAPCCSPRNSVHTWLSPCYAALTGPLTKWACGPREPLVAEAVRALSYPHARSQAHARLTPAGPAKLLNLSARRLWSPEQVTANLAAETTSSCHLPVSLDLRGRLRGLDQVVCSWSQRLKLVSAGRALTRRWEGWRWDLLQTPSGPWQNPGPWGCRTEGLFPLAGGWAILSSQRPCPWPLHLQTNTHLLVPGAP